MFILHVTPCGSLASARRPQSTRSVFSVAYDQLVYKDRNKDS